MAQIESRCLAPIGLCRARATLLESDGTPATGADASFVSGNLMSLAVTADVQAATRRTVTTGCDCVVATDPGREILLGFNFELVDALWEPAFVSLMTGATPIYDDSDIPVIVGYNMEGGEIVGCGGDTREVAFEAWVKAYSGAQQDADTPWIHLIWPRTRWQIGQNTYNVDFTNPPLSGVALSNSNWGSGPYDDVPLEGTTPLQTDFYSKFATATEPPTASCALQTVS